MMYALISLCVVGLYALNVWRNKFDIVNDGSLYLRRFHLIRAKHFKVFLHRIYKADGDRHMHNHPWPDSGSLILWGGYREERVGTIDLGRAGMFVGSKVHHLYQASDTMRLYPGTYHRITDVFPNTWTLFWTRARAREWSFLVDGKPVDWHIYLGYPMDTDLGDCYNYVDTKQKR
jgi:hypothetical protein